MPRTRSGDSGAATEPTPQDAIKDLLGGLSPEHALKALEEASKGLAAANSNTRTEPFEGRGKTKRTSDSIDDIESNLERPEILDETRRRQMLSPLTELQHLKENTTLRAALWSLP